MANVLHSNYRDEYETPPEFFAALGERFDLRVDLFASDSNALCDRYHTKISGTERRPRWGGWAWANPPYGKGLDKLLSDVVVEPFLTSGMRTVALLPGNTDTAWFHRWVLPWANIVWVKGRIQFLLNGKRPINPKTGKPSGNTGGNMLAIYGPNLLRCNAIDTKGRPVQ